MNQNLQLKRELQILEDIDNNDLNFQDDEENNINKDSFNNEIDELNKEISYQEDNIKILTELAAEKNALEGLIGKNLNSNNSLIENLKVSKFNFF